MNKFYIIYKDSDNRKDFIEKCKKKFPNLAESSFMRRWYDCKKVKLTLFEEDEKNEPSIQKMIIYKDMKRIYKNVTRDMLYKYKFSAYECNWLEDKGYI